MTDSPTDPERLAEPLTDMDYTVDGNGTRLAIVNADAIDALITRLAAAEATLQKIIDHDPYDDFFATTLARTYMEAHDELL